MCVVLIYFISDILYNTYIHTPRAMTTQVACDGRGIALDDMHELALVERKHEIWQELLQNAARVGHAARSNVWLRPLFRKYKRTCREILEQKKKEITVFTKMCDYCDLAGDKSGLKLIHDEMNQIHAEIKDLEHMPYPDDDSDGSLTTDESDNEDVDADNVVADNVVADNAEDEKEEDDEDTDSVHSSSSSSSASVSSSSSSSSSQSEMDLEDFM